MKMDEVAVKTKQYAARERKDDVVEMPWPTWGIRPLSEIPVPHVEKYQPEDMPTLHDRIEIYRRGGEEAEIPARAQDVPRRGDAIVDFNLKEMYKPLEQRL